MEGGQGQPFEHDLHADELQVPAFVGEDLVQQILEAAGHRIGEADFRLQIAVEHLHVPRLVEGLRGGIQLRVEARRTGRQLRCHQERTLLAMQKLRQRPRLIVAHEGELPLRAEGVEGRIALPRVGFDGLFQAFRRRWRGLVPVRRLRPRHVLGAVPVELLAQLVQPLDAVVHHAVVPVVRAVQRCAEDLGHMCCLRGRQIQLRVELLQAPRRVLDVADLHWRGPRV